MKKVLVISPVHSHPINGGSSFGVNNVCNNLKTIGLDVHFLYLANRTTGFGMEQEHIDEMKKFWREKFFFFESGNTSTYAPAPPKNIYERIRQKILFSIKSNKFYTNKIDDFYDNRTNEFLKDLQAKENFDVVVVNYVFYSKALTIFSKNVLKIIETHDLFANRHLIFHKMGLPNKWYSFSPEEEIKGLKRADVIIAVQQSEKKYFSKKIKNKKVISAGRTLDISEFKQKERTSNKLLYIASGNNTNLISYKYFYENIFPLITKNNSDIELLVAGAICGLINNDKNIKKLGIVNNLNDIYDSCDVVVNPVISGTGLKIKTIEALFHCKPLVTTSVGAEGLEEGINKAFFVEDQPEKFADKIIELLTNIDLYNKTSKESRKFAIKYKENNLNELRNLFT
ncbi:MAG: glycosyltransferase family 4 protein [Bacteroidales bacterium]|nr:glycosyltransferase family 4 protein [Bacteroidales bacterium]